MKLKNTTDWPDYFLRRMTAWCCRQLSLPVKHVRIAEFGKRSSGCYNGRAWYSRRKIRVVIGPASAFPVQGHLYPGRTSEAFRCPDYQDRIEGLIGVTAHELQHLFDEYERGQSRGGERHTRHAEHWVMECFRPNREQLLAAWSVEPKWRQAKPKTSRRKQNEARVRKLLAAWERKARLAKTKLSTYRKKVRYYERTAANQNTGP